MEEVQILLYYLLLSIAATLFIHDSVILFIRGRNNRPRQILGITTLIWGVMYLLLLFGSYYDQITFPVFSGESLITSHIFICIMFLYPLEVLLPGWLNRKRIMLMLLPITVLSMIYYLGLRLTGQHIEDFASFRGLLQSVGHFNVWYRFILFVCNFIFIYLLMQLLDRNVGKYIKWQNMNFSDRESVDITWMGFYKNMMIAICVCYIVVAVWGSMWSVIVHTILVISSFSVLFYKGLFYENSYTEDFSEKSSKEGIQEVSNKEDLIIGETIDKDYNDSSFEAKLPLYVKKLKEWMEEEKPYLYKEFKLIDVTRVLSLNRSYLSRVFNEGFHQNFSEVVRGYRIRYAKEIMTKHPDLPLCKVAELCGFSSDSTFFRAFQMVTGTTPKQFKQQL